MKNRWNVMVRLGAAFACCVFLWACDAGKWRGAIEAKGTLSPGAAVQKTDCLIDPVYFQDNGIVCSRDMAYLLERYTRQINANPSDSQAAHTAALIKAVRAWYPQAILFQCKTAQSALSLMPYDWAPPVPPVRRAAADVVVIGGELPSITTAIEAADRGFSVIVLYAGPLGGISADTGANLRFFDFVNPTTHPESQVKLFRNALKMSNYVCIPPNTDSLIKAYIDKKYKHQITLIQTHSYDSLNVTASPNHLTQIETSEGTLVSGRYFIDTDPESRVAEKCAVPMKIDTPDLSYGVVFDVTGLTSGDLDSLRSHDLIDPQKLMDLAGVTLEQVKSDHRAYESYHRLQSFMTKDSIFLGHGYRLGYSALAQGFDFKMQCEGLANPSNESLRWVNEHRDTSGFNISVFGDTANFNSISYVLPRNIMQCSHSFGTDSLFEPIRSVDMPALNDYLCYVTGDSGLSLQIPHELYVRKSTAFFELLHPYQDSEFNGRIATKFYTFYPMDLRGLHERDPFGWKIVQGFRADAHGKHFWGARASATETRVDNLFLVNKDGVTPAFSGGQRILGSQINMGAALVAALSAKNSHF
jgi:hypothetical protein